MKVVKIEKAKKSGCVVVTVKFDGAEKEYTYVRNAFSTKKSQYAIVDGKKVWFDSEYNYIKTTDCYETKGVKQQRDSSKMKSVRDEVANAAEKAVEQVVAAAEEHDWSKPVIHEAYDKIKTCMECNIPVYLAGPAGAGKNYTVEQIAKELGMNFFFSNSIQQEYKLTGFIDAGGNYHETEFYKACTSERDCVFFLDEIDASIPEVLVLLNAAIANGYFEFPTGIVTLEHVHFVAAGNTVGSGANDLYAGRMVLDQATLDRFAIIEFDYDRNVEMHITKGNEELVDFVRELRKQAIESGVRATFSLRCLTMVSKLEGKGMDLKVIIKIAVMKGLDKDTINTFNAWGMTGNKYAEALREVQMAG